MLRWTPALAGVAAALASSPAARAAGDVPVFAAQVALEPDALVDARPDFRAHTATDGAGQWVTVWQTRDPVAGDWDVMVSRSSDDGASWSAPALLHPSLSADAGDDTNPQVASGGGGAWVVVWQSDGAPGGGGTDFDILVSRSSDAGASWTAPAYLSPGAGSDTATDLAPYVTSDGAGTWLAVWQSNETLPQSDNDFDVFWARSTDDGASWTAPTRVDPGSVSDLRNDTEPTLTSDGAGTWIAVWGADEALANFDSDQDVLLARSTDAGATWSAPLLLNPDEGAGRRDDVDAHVATDGAGTWVAVWASNDSLDLLEEDFDIFVSRSTDAGQSWTPPAPLNRDAPTDGGVDFDPQIVADGPGRFVVVWQSCDAFASNGTDYDVFYAFSDDGGLGWSLPLLLHPALGSDAASDADPQLATDGAGHFVAVSYAAGASGPDLDVRVARGGEPFSPGEALHPTSAAGSSYDAEASLASDRSGGWVAVWVSDDPLSGIGADLDLLVSRSGDAGVSWSDPIALSSGAATDSGDDLLPQVVADGAGRWGAVWQSTDDQGGALGPDPDVLAAFSDDAGASWTAPAPVHGNASTDTGSDELARMATDGAGSWVTVWQSNEPLAGSGSDFDILVARSVDAGASWLPAAVLNSAGSQDSTDDLDPDVATDGGGTWVAVWDADTGSDQDVLVSRSLDAGASWSTAVPLDPNAGADTGIDRRPRIAGDGTGTWLAVWESDEPSGGLGSDFDILLSRSTDGGASWTAAVPLDANAYGDTAVDTQPRLAWDGTGSWTALWSSRPAPGADGRILAARSVDGGLTWTPATAISGSVGDHWDPSLATDGAGAWVAVFVSTDPQGGALGSDPDLLVARALGPDRDGDGLADGAEQNLHGTDPALADTDGDGLSDGDEIAVYGSNPFSVDSDGDTLPEAMEALVYGTDPADADTDGDGLADDQELLVHGTDPLDTDSDNDDLEDGEELLVYGTDPTDKDSDDDGYEDGTEIAMGFDPNDPESHPPATVPVLGPVALLGLGLLIGGGARLARVRRTPA